MIQIETTNNHEIWCRISESSQLNSALISEINTEVTPMLPGFERLYINLKAISKIESGAIYALRIMMSDFMSKGCSVRFVSVSEELSEIFENLSLSSDG